MLLVLLREWKLVLAGAIALMAIAGWGMFAWEHSDYQDLKRQLADQKAEAEKTLTKANNKVALLQETRDTLNLAIEDQHAKTQQALAAAADDNRSLASDIKRLQQSRSGDGGQHALPGSSHPAAGAAKPAAVGDRLGRCEALLAEGAGLLAGTAQQSDQGAQLSQELSQWAKTVAGAQLPADKSDP